MKFLAGLLGLVVVAALAGGVDRAFAEKRVALIIGNSAYKHVAKLPNPASDARAVSDLLKRSGFDVVESRQDLSINDMRRAMRDFSDRTRDADIAVVFYAGHGIEVDGTNYLLPVDAALERDIDVEDEALPLDRIVKIMEPVRRLRLVILDACRDNPFMKTMKRTVTTRSIGRGLAKVEVTTSDTLIAFAAKAGSTASDGDGRNSPFTTALLNNIATPGLDLRIAFGRVRDEVLKRTASKQEPFVYGSLGGTTVSLVPAPVPVAAPAPVIAAPAPAPASQINLQAEMRRDYELAKEVGTKEAWDQFLSIYQTGFHAGLARAARAKVIAEEQRRLASATPAPVIETPKPGPDISETVRQLQAELRRLGCYPGIINGEWGNESRKALELFNRHAGMRLDVRVASLDMLDVVRAKPTRVCPLQCEHGYRAQGETCVKITCGSNQTLADDGTCQQKREPARSVAKPEPRPERARQAEPPKPAGGGCVFDRMAPAGTTVQQGQLGRC